MTNYARNGEMTVYAVHVDDEYKVSDEVACAARTTTDECTVEVNVHAVHLRCTVKRHIVHAVHVDDECTVNDEMVFTDRVQRLWSQFM